MTGKRLAYWLRTWADRIDHAGAPKIMHWSFTFETHRGIVFREDGKGCPLVYLGDAEYEKAHAESDSAAAENAGQHEPEAPLAAVWCEPDNCPASICGGPHREVVTDLGTEILRQDQDPMGKPVARTGKDAE